MTLLAKLQKARLKVGKQGALDDLGQQRTDGNCQKDQNWAASCDWLLLSGMCLFIFGDNCIVAELY